MQQELVCFSDNLFHDNLLARALVQKINLYSALERSNISEKKSLITLQRSDSSISDAELMESQKSMNYGWYCTELGQLRPYWLLRAESIIERMRILVSVDIVSVLEIIAGKGVHISDKQHWKLTFIPVSWLQQTSGMKWTPSCLALPHILWLMISQSASVYLWVAQQQLPQMKCHTSWREWSRKNDAID